MEMTIRLDELADGSYRPGTDVARRKEPRRVAAITTGQLFRRSLLVRVLAYVEGERLPLAVPLDIDQRVPP
jgi:hypothetical protein